MTTHLKTSIQPDLKKKHKTTICFVKFPRGPKTDPFLLIPLPCPPFWSAKATEDDHLPLRVHHWQSLKMPWKVSRKFYVQRTVQVQFVAGFHLALSSNSPILVTVLCCFPSGSTWGMVLPPARLCRGSAPWPAKWPWWAPVISVGSCCFTQLSVVMYGHLDMVWLYDIWYIWFLYNIYDISI